MDRSQDDFYSYFDTGITLVNKWNKGVYFDAIRGLAWLHRKQADDRSVSDASRSGAPNGGRRHFSGGKTGVKAAITGLNTGWNHDSKQHLTGLFYVEHFGLWARATRTCALSPFHEEHFFLAIHT